MAPVNKLSDEEVLQQFICGDEGAFTEVYNRYWKPLLALAYRHTKDKFLSEEIVQEVFVSLWNRKDKVKINSLEGYLATAIKFSVFKHTFNTNRRERLLAGFSFNSSSALPEDILQAKFLEDYINGIVERLPEKCRYVYLKSRHEGLNIKEIAEEMSLSEKTVEAHLTKALKVLRLNLKEILVLVLFVKYR
ncbi:RNA polymerase sigma-70 factor [Mucilaginibacter sp. RS28]|uniref:RNA polymerase sigma-70 factor n=1 Tax=Mucilaginibacter straminoryzae TaxID=2932774 RepID=A0A9X2B8G2_9SPHI|nr:RNA polymerase sigma-70 factor [Mucilaginibacter straminoryzae]MCJ8209579.1 RNA polymerase sigma-70 factor [Mucilaginibacter straminoryzae]